MDTIKKTQPTHDTAAAKARDAKRLEALDTVLAAELASHQDYLQPEELISHDELEEAVLAVLGLELPESKHGLFELINETMGQWHWQCLTFNCGLDHYYALPQKSYANLVSLGGKNIILQADKVFPEDMSDVTDNLWEAEFAEPLLEEKKSVDPRNKTGRYSDQALFHAFSEAHLINPIHESLL